MNKITNSSVGNLIYAGVRAFGWFFWYKYKFITSKSINSNKDSKEVPLSVMIPLVTKIDGGFIVKIPLGSIIRWYRKFKKRKTRS